MVDCYENKSRLVDQNQFNIGSQAYHIGEQFKNGKIHGAENDIYLIIKDLEVSNKVALPGETITVSYLVENISGIDVKGDTRLVFNDEYYINENFTIKKGEKLSFSAKFEKTNAQMNGFVATGGINPTKSLDNKITIIIYNPVSSYKFPISIYSKEELNHNGLVPINGVYRIKVGVSNGLSEKATYNIIVNGEKLSNQIILGGVINYHEFEGVKVDSNQVINIVLDQISPWDALPSTTTLKLIDPTPDPTIPQLDNIDWASIMSNFYVFPFDVKLEENKKTNILPYLLFGGLGVGLVFLITRKKKKEQ